MFRRLRNNAARALAVWLAVFPGLAGAAEVTVFAAASLREALTEAAAGWEAETGHAAVISFAGSSALARQIMAGAPAELFVSASSAWMDAVEAAGAMDAGSRVDLASNSLVVIGGAGAAPVALDGAALTAALGGGRLAMALVDAVPAGQYGRAALETLGLWEAMAPHVAQADNVRAALALVATGAAPLGIVYATDAAAEPRVSVVAELPEETHPRIVYPAARVAGAGAAAADLLEYLAGPEGQAAFARHGFRAAR